MIIELRGVEFRNKGAELMLRAIVEKLGKDIKDVQFVMENSTSAPRSKHVSNKILTKTRFEIRRLRKLNFWGDFSKLYSILPVSARKKKGFVNDNEIDVVIDGSGFAFSDQWGLAHADKKLGAHVKLWKKQGKKVILLPQAFGPFADPALREKMKHIIEYSDLIFARDKKSLEYLQSLGVGADKIILAPDFTNLIKGFVPKDFNPKTCEVAVIPNAKMITTSKTDSSGEGYFKVLKTIISGIEQKGHLPYFLIHEGQGDINIAKQLNEQLSSKIPMVINDDPLAIKGIIGASKAIVTSRFHGLVSALSQNVPCLATSWSHKYEMLLEDYNYTAAIIGKDTSEEEILQKLDMILNEDSRKNITENLAKMGAVEKEKTQKMWKVVTEFLEK